jgi:hypothetical protein
MSAVARLLASFRIGAQPLRVLSASGQLGYGIPEPAFRAGIARNPQFIGADMGSIDPGPHYLGSGEMATAASITRRDLEMVLVAARELDVPLVIGSAGTAGAKPHLDATVTLVRDIAAQRGLRFRLATIESDVPAALVIDALRAGHLEPIGPMPAPTEAEIAACTNIVGQCGTETLRRALERDPDVLIAGRACDTAIFAALPEMLGFPRGPVMHMAKIIECTSLCCTPGGRDAMLATFDLDGFELESMHPDRHATPASVAAHALYEQTNATAVVEPTGTVIFDAARYEAIDAHRTRVTGARWVDANEPSIKVEGALRVGHRVVLIAGSVDPVFIAQLTAILPRVEQAVRRIVPGDWQAYPRTYGAGAIGGRTLATSPAEVGLIIELIAPVRELASAAAAVFKQNLLHFGFEGRLSTAGNIAFPFTPPELDAGAAYRFALYHVMRGVRPDQLFKVAISDVNPPSRPSP